MKVRFAGVLLVWCLLVLKCHSTPLPEAQLFSLFAPSESQEDCNGVMCDDQCIGPAQICDGVVNCADGSDEKNCGDEDAVLYYSSSCGIKGMHLNSLQNSSIIYYDAVAPAVTVNGHDIYWTSSQQGSIGIHRASMNDSKSHSMISFANPRDVDVDWITGNIYFTDSTFKCIGVCSNSLQFCSILHNNKNIGTPISITLSPENGILFWTDLGSKHSMPVIGKSGMDGSKAEVFVSDNLDLPNGICSDTPNERVYWVDMLRNVIESIGFDGTDRKVILSDGVKFPISVSVLGSKLYWNIWNSSEILECDKLTGKNTKILIQDPSDLIYGIHVQHPQQNTREAENPCASNPCSDICLLAPGSKNNASFSCACFYGRELSGDLATCRVKEVEDVVLLVAENCGNGGEFQSENQYLGRPKMRNVQLDSQSRATVVGYTESRITITDAKSNLTMEISEKNNFVLTFGLNFE